MAAKTFGEFFKELRIRKGVTLREFCQKYDLDPGNISKLERGGLQPPQDMQKLRDYAHYLGVKEGSPDWHNFVDLASTGAGVIPQDILDDQELVKRLPVLFRTLRRRKLTKESLKELIEKLKKV
jgi:transcriptional regulator with XRE-family HTH domain